MRISNSFSEGEIQVLEFIVQTLLRGGTPTMATRHKEFASLCRKVMAMKGKVNEQKPAQAPWPRRTCTTPRCRSTATLATKTSRQSAEQQGLGFVGALG
jgi:hypothetical protein